MSLRADKELVLIGGGHSHAIALRQFGMEPLPHVRLTLISDGVDTPYSGMLPGYVAGFYSHQECHIDLRSLSQFAGAQLLVDRAVGLDLENRRVWCANREPLAFDGLSIDIGSTPTIPNLPGLGESVIPVKPVKQFLVAWEALCDRVTRAPEQSLTLGIVGGGAGGVELALNMQRRVQDILTAANQPLKRLTIHLFHRDGRVMSSHSAWVQRRLQRILEDRGVQLHLNQTVQRVTEGQVVCESGLTIACDAVFWVTQASAPDWLGKSGLAVDREGFIQVGETLQSLSHPFVFSAGDIATMVDHPRPKAGVFAVRQGKPLADNLRRFLAGEPLRPFHPQQQYLSLIGTGDRAAIASRGRWGFQSPLLWWWKDWIDRRFMAQFSQLPTP